MNTATLNPPTVTVFARDMKGNKHYAATLQLACAAAAKANKAYKEEAERKAAA